MQVNARYRKFLLGGVMVMLLTSLTMMGASSPVSSIGEGPPPHNIHVITDNPEDPFPGTPYTAATLASASIEVKGIEALETLDFSNLRGATVLVSSKMLDFPEVRSWFVTQYKSGTGVAVMGLHLHDLVKLLADTPLLSFQVEEGQTHEKFMSSYRMHDHSVTPLSMVAKSDHCGATINIPLYYREYSEWLSVGSIVAALRHSC